MISVGIISIRNKIAPENQGLKSCGEYRSRTDDLLHAMQAL
jgi:hypothetical protein